MYEGKSIAEMKHAESLAERIDYLGGDPTTRPEAIAGMAATTLAEMATADRDSELDAIARYRAAIAIAADVGDVTTRTIFEGILAEEEEHHKTFEDMLG